MGDDPSVETPYNSDENALKKTEKTKHEHTGVRQAGQLFLPVYSHLSTQDL